ncbi:two-component system, NtrC family, C4-dicarboxylate transport sensor histidine kinase DctB [Pseudomonas delhiensis]|uniref:C4-dicarboxylate transport sensor protein DctB n=1 Tax=Pseudomonas delhiensis TaxID=366289 RepID=A0A239MSK8_9PSED|nr:ATP-binding protein [Pseudomonas delhiensis]SDK22363.1 two-component system, NtrC family, C4-dicarboxylate transport sensor histidine kinase DctB [Pseudomonas delhiensis]SNT45721.1 two-component system, NtrC family, C4-dicarboxylate transport sensor histidine kinase DctB [Pseudomonas delhiensis]
MTFNRPLRLILASLLVLAGLLLSVYWAGEKARHRSLLAEAEAAHEQLGLYVSSLRTLLERYRSLPAVLALDPELRQALAGPVQGDAQRALNLKLERINAAARSSTLELLDRDGLAVAASNWRLPTSYVGHNYAFRPYFRQTIAQGTGRFYAVGVTTGIPGYFLANAVRDEAGRFLGAIVVKLEFPDLEQQWSQTPDLVLVSDTKGIVFLANHPGWRYRELQPLDTFARLELAQTRQYDRQPLTPLQHRTLQPLGEDSRLVRVGARGDETDYLWQSLSLPDDDWTLHLLRDARGVQSDVATARLAAAGAWLALVFLAMLLQQRWRIARLRQRSREELERLVEQRTADLRTAQDGLVQAAKLAALGQMSAALAHEINQPLTAQRMHLASVRLLLDAGRNDEARAALARLDELLERMAALTGHLKTFARKTPGGLRERIELGHVLEQALQLLTPRIRAEQVEISQVLSVPAWVLGDAIRLEQVLVNLLRNALDAVAGAERPRIEVTLRHEGEQWSLEIADNGPGIAGEHLGNVFDPFFTTKPVGEGLGLGLAVSYGIVHELGGRLEAANRPEGGALFRLVLPAASEET